MLHRLLVSSVAATTRSARTAATTAASPCAARSTPALRTPPASSAGNRGSTRYNIHCTDARLQETAMQVPVPVPVPDPGPGPGPGRASMRSTARPAGVDPIAAQAAAAAQVRTYRDNGVKHSSSSYNRVHATPHCNSHCLLGMKSKLCFSCLD